MERSIALDAPSFVFTYFSEYQVEYIISAFVLIYLLCFWLILRCITKSKSSIIVIVLGVLFFSFIYTLPPKSIELLPYGKLNKSIPIHSKIEEISTKGKYFIESTTNRTILLRGVNFGGGSKTPVNQPTHIKHK